MPPADRSYNKSHEWCKIDGETATIGITDHAVSHLSDLVFLDLPAKGSSVTLGESFGEIESVKAVSNLYSPVSGEVIEVNEALPDNLELLSSSPFEEAWMIKVKFTSQEEGLMDAAAYQKFCETEGE